MEQVNSNFIPGHLASEPSITEANNLTTQYKKSRTENREALNLKKKHKSIEETKIQKERELEWLIEDKKMLKFTISIQELDKFVSGDFEIIEINNQKCIKQVEEWNKIQQKGDNETNVLSSNQCSNIILKNKIMKLASPILNLRSLAIECEVTILMSGESHFFIMSRGREDFSSQMAICCISKELESSRKFVSFAILDPSSDIEEGLMLKTLKKQEIPRQENYIKSLDIAEFKFTFVDNGDNHCFIAIDKSQKSDIFVADFFPPVTETCNVMFGAAGELISVKSLSIIQTERNSALNNRSDLIKNTQSCNCCIIF